MADIQTKPTQAPVEEFLNAVKDESVREDCRIIAEMMRKATKASPRMWGPSIVGFGTSSYRDAKGKAHDWMEVAFSPRKQYIAVYLTMGLDGDDQLLAKLGKHTHGKSCLCLKRLSDVHRPTLKKLIEASVRQVRQAQRAC